MHGLNAVHHQIDDDLLQLNPVTTYHGQIGCQLGSQRYPMTLQLTLHQRDDFSNDLIQIERCLLDFRLVRKRPDTPHHFARPVGVVYHPFHRSSRSGKVGRSAVQPPQARVGIGDDRGERLVHFMGDGSCQFAQGSDAGYMGEFRLRLVQRLLGLICTDHGGDIGTGTAIAEKISLRVKERFTTGSHMYRRASPAQGVLEIAKRLMGVERRPMLSPFFGVCLDVCYYIPASQPGEARGFESNSIDVL